MNSVLNIELSNLVDQILIEFSSPSKRSFRKLNSKGYSYGKQIDSNTVFVDGNHLKMIKTFNKKFKTDYLDGYTKTPNIKIAEENFFKFKKNFQWHDKFNCKQQIDASRMLRKSVLRVSDKLSYLNGSKLYFLEGLIDKIKNLQTSPGYSFKPGQTKGDVLQSAYVLARTLAHRVKNQYSHFWPPAMLGCRGHLSLLKEPKTRPVWVIPFEMILIEKMFAQDIIDKAQRAQQHIHFGKDAMPNLLKWCQTDLYGLGYKNISIDWSGFDTTIPRQLIELAFAIVESKIDFSTVYKTNGDFILGENKTIRMHRVFQFIKKYFINTKMMLPNGDIYQKADGLPSGSTFTSLIGSIVNMIVIDFLFQLQGVEDFPADKYLGDDSSIMLQDTTDVNLELLSQHAEFYFGMKLNADKTKVFQKNEQIEFLGYKFNGSDIYMSTEDLFRRLLYSESPPQNLSVSMTKMLAYYKLGGSFDPLFCEYLDFIRNEFPETNFTQVILKGDLRRKLDALGIQALPQGLIKDVFDDDPLFQSYQIVGFDIRNDQIY